jgi:hypothetical protein
MLLNGMSPDHVLLDPGDGKSAGRISNLP